MARFANPYTPRSQLGEGLSNIMTAMFASGNRASRASRSAAQELRDDAEARKALAEAERIRQTTEGRANYERNIARSLGLPDADVDAVMERRRTGLWPMREDPDLQGPVMPEASPMQAALPPRGWKPEYDTQLNDAARVAASLLGSDSANFKDLNAATGQPGRDRLIQSIVKSLLPKTATPAPVAPGITQESFGSFMMPQDATGIHDVLPNLSADQERSARDLKFELVRGEDGPQLMAPPDEVVTSAVPGLDSGKLIEGALRMLNIDPQISNSMISAANANRQVQEFEAKTPDEKGFGWKVGINPQTGKREHVRLGPGGKLEWSGVESPINDPLISFGGMTPAVDENTGKSVFIRAPNRGGPVEEVAGYTPPPTAAQQKRDEEMKAGTINWKATDDTITEMQDIVRKHPVQTATLLAPLARAWESLLATGKATFGEKTPVTDTPGIRIQSMKEGLVMQMGMSRGRMTKDDAIRLDRAIGLISTGTPENAIAGLELMRELNNKYNNVSRETGELPEEARARLKEGVDTTFSNGQVWTLRNGKAERVR